MQHLPKSELSIDKVASFQAEVELNKEWLLVSPESDMWSFRSINDIKEFLNDKALHQRPSVGGTVS